MYLGGKSLGAPDKGDKPAGYLHSVWKGIPGLWDMTKIHSVRDSGNVYGIRDLINCYPRSVIRQYLGTDAGLGVVYLIRITICHLSSLNSYNVLWAGYSKLMNGLKAASCGAWSADVRDYC